MATTEPAEFLKNRSSVPVLVVTTTGQSYAKIRESLKALGFGNISSSLSHAQAIDRIKSRGYPLVLFDAKSKDIPASEFVNDSLSSGAQSTLIAITPNPQIDDVFSLIRAGTQAFLLTPFTTEDLEKALVRSTQGIKLSPILLNSEDRNTGLVLCILNNLYRVAMLMHNARKYAYAKKDLDRYRAQLYESAEMARVFCDGDLEDLRERVIDACIDRAKTAKTRLGVTRKHLARKRQAGKRKQRGSKDS